MTSYYNMAVNLTYKLINLNLTYKILALMLKVAIVSLLSYEKIVKTIEKLGVKIVDSNPDFVITYGGDGTILYSERIYPSIPKITFKGSELCMRCYYNISDVEKVIENIIRGNYHIVSEVKLEAFTKGQRLQALNEIQVHNKVPTRAIRFSVFVDGREFRDLVGDGVIISTPFGSTGYYMSVGGKPFKKGIGVAFNNLHMRKIRSFTVPLRTKIKVTVDRGDCFLIADNADEFIELGTGDKVLIMRASGKAKFVKIFE
jgi:NAD+ kinase